MRTLYEMTDNWLQLMDMLENSELDEQTIADTLESLDYEIEEKADNYAKIMKELEAKATAYKTEEARLKANRTTLENNIKRLKDNLYNCMKTTGKTKFDTDLFKFNIVRNGGKQPLDIYGEVPEEYQKVIYEADTDKIRTALEEGQELNFAILQERGESLRIK